MKTDLQKAFKTVKTPAYVFSPAEFAERVSMVNEAFGDVGLCYSIKANPFLLPYLPDSFSRIEVCSPGELHICKALGLDPEMIIFSGLNKSRAEIAEAVAYGVRTVTAESRRHLEYIESVAREADADVDVLVRLSAESQFGIDRDELIGLLKSRPDGSRSRVTGIHYFTGTGKRRGKVIERELALLSDYILEVKSKTGVELHAAEYGAGLTCYYFEKNAGELERELLNEAAEPVRQFEKKMASRGMDVTLTVEMGRFFAAPCGYYVTGIVDTKSNDGVNYCIVDGGAHQMHYDGQLKGMKLPDITHIRQSDDFSDSSDPNLTAESRGTAEWTVAGSLCTTEDVFARSVPFEGLGVDDRLVFHRTGAYSLYEGMALFLSRDLPGIYILRDDGTLELQRERIETAELNKKSL